MIANDQSQFSFGLTRRNSFDNELNNHGKRLLEICKSADLRILNGRVSGDSLGRTTFHGKTGVSVVDYVICDQNLFSHFKSFIVKKPTYLSDHSPLVTWLNIGTKICNQDAFPKNDTLTRLPKQFLWESNSSPKFKEVLQSSSMQILIQDYLDDINSAQNVNTSVEQVENILIATAKRCLKIQTMRRHKRAYSSPQIKNGLIGNVA